MVKQITSNIIEKAHVRIEWKLTLTLRLNLGIEVIS